MCLICLGWELSIFRHLFCKNNMSKFNECCVLISFILKITQKRTRHQHFMDKCPRSVGRVSARASVNVRHA